MKTIPLAVGVWPPLVLFLLVLWYVLTGQSQAEAAALGAGASVVGQALLAVRLRGLRGAPSRQSGWRMAYNTSSRLALVALSVVILGPRLTVGTGALFLSAYFVCQLLAWIGLAGGMRR